MKLLSGGRIIYGGKYNKDRLYIPYIDRWYLLDDPIMKEEIFGPIFPILEYSSLDEAIGTINSHSKPLALYFFFK